MNEIYIIRSQMLIGLSIIQMNEKCFQYSKVEAFETVIYFCHIKETLSFQTQLRYSKAHLRLYLQIYLLIYLDFSYTDN
jgi:hypothetical protein